MIKNGMQEMTVSSSHDQSAFTRPSSKQLQRRGIDITEYLMRGKEKKSLIFLSRNLGFYFPFYIQVKCANNTIEIEDEFAGASISSEIVEIYLSSLGKSVSFSYSTLPHK